VEHIQEREWRDEIRSLIREVVRDEMRSFKHQCRFQISEEEARDLGGYIHMMTALGDGEVSKGIDVIRDNHRWLKLQRDRSDRLSLAILIFVATTIAGGALTALWLGLKQLAASKV
jgi:hypothetical protein